jgi:hypothetical protein
MHAEEGGGGAAADALAARLCTSGGDGVAATSAARALCRLIDLCVITPELVLQAVARHGHQAPPGARLRWAASLATAGAAPSLLAGLAVLLPDPAAVVLAAVEVVDEGGSESLEPLLVDLALAAAAAAHDGGGAASAAADDDAAYYGVLLRAFRAACAAHAVLEAFFITATAGSMRLTLSDASKVLGAALSAAVAASRPTEWWRRVLPSVARRFGVGELLALLLAELRRPDGPPPLGISPALTVLYETSPTLQDAFSAHLAEAVASADGAGTAIAATLQALWAALPTAAYERVLAAAVTAAAERPAGAGALATAFCAAAAEPVGAPEAALAAHLAALPRLPLPSDDERVLAAAEVTRSRLSELRSADGAACARAEALLRSLLDEYRLAGGGALTERRAALLRGLGAQSLTLVQPLLLAPPSSAPDARLRLGFIEARAHAASASRTF